MCFLSSWSSCSLFILLTLSTYQQLTLVASAGKVFKQQLLDDVLISDYGLPKPSDSSGGTAVNVNNLVDNAPQCFSLNAAFAAASDNQQRHSCNCFLDVTNLNDTASVKIATTAKVLIRCTQSVMPVIYKELNSIDAVNVSELRIVDAHAVVIPSHMFAQIRPEVLAIERTRLAMIRDGAFKNFGTTLRTLILRDNLLGSLNPEIFVTLRHLQELDIGRNKISQLSFEILNSLGDLKVLRVDNNNLEQITDGTFETLPNLKVLDLSNNKLQRITNNTFLGLRNLEELYMQGNHFAELYPNAFSHLKKLRILNISNNSLRSLSLVDLPNLEILSIDGNQLSSLLKLKLNLMPNLEQLFVNNNQIDRIEIEDLHSLESLDKLNLFSLDGNMISTIEPSALHAVANIEILSLQKNRLKQLSNGVRSYLDELKAVKQLNLAYNRLNKISALDLSTLKTLEVLQLNDNLIEQIDPRAFYNLHLKKLSLATNHLTGLANGIFESFNISNLQFIDLTGNPWECQYTDQWLDGWLSKLKQNCIKNYKQLTCTATTTQILIDANNNELLMSSAVPLYQANSLFISPFRTLSSLFGHKPWILVSISAVSCLILLVILMVFCFMSCKKIRYRRTVYDAYHIGSCNGIASNAFLLDGKQRRALPTFHNYSVKSPEPDKASYPVTLKLLRYEQI